MRLYWLPTGTINYGAIQFGMLAFCYAVQSDQNSITKNTHTYELANDTNLSLFLRYGMKTNFNTYDLS